MGDQLSACGIFVASHSCTAMHEAVSNEFNFYLLLLSTSQEQSVKELEQKIKTLEKQLEWEKLRTEALNTMIDIAEKDLTISIRKKPGAQQ